MTTEYGQKILGAFKAVAQLHSDTSQLLVDCDKYIGKGRPSIFGSYATRDLTYNFQTTFWMAEGVYRYYQAGPGLVDAVTVAFFNGPTQEEAGDETEPLLLVARVQYVSGTDATKTGDGDAQSIKGLCKEWDVWGLYFNWGKSKDLGNVLSYSEIDKGRISWARLIAVPLFAIKRIEDVTELMDRVIAASEAG